jgi:hypothetical protein
LRPHDSVKIKIKNRNDQSLRPHDSIKIKIKKRNEIQSERNRA